MKRLNILKSYLPLLPIWQLYLQLPRAGGAHILFWFQLEVNTRRICLKSGCDNIKYFSYGLKNRQHLLKWTQFGDNGHLWSCEPWRQWALPLDQLSSRDSSRCFHCKLLGSPVPLKQEMSSFCQIEVFCWLRVVVVWSPESDMQPVLPINANSGTSLEPLCEIESIVGPTLFYTILVTQGPQVGNYGVFA